MYYSITRSSVGWACVVHLSFCFEKRLYRTFHRRFLPNFKYFGQMVLEKIFWIGQSQTRIAYCSYISLCQIFTKYGNFVQDFTYVIPTSNNLLCLLVSEEKIFQISTNQKQEFPMAIMIMYTWDEMRKLYRGPTSKNFALFGQVVSEKIFRNRPTRDKICL
jgi:hypothetical protein